MGNESLVRGAALSAPRFNDIGAAAFEGASKIGNYYQNLHKERKQKKEAQTAKVEGYLNQMPAGIELSKIPPAQQQAVSSWTKNQRMLYSEAAQAISSGNLEVGSDDYIEAMSTMDSIKSSFVNLNNNLETFKANKTEYLKSSTEGALSNGNDSNQGDLLSSLYTDETDMIFDGNGNLAFQSGEAVVNINDVPDYFNKDFQSADTLVTLNSDIYNSGKKFDDTMSNMYRQKILNMVKKGGRETTLSLATDDLIQEGGLGIIDQDLLYNPERQAELEKTVVDSYMNILSGSADAGFNKKEKSKEKNLNNTNVGDSAGSWYDQNFKGKGVPNGNEPTDAKPTMDQWKIMLRKNGYGMSQGEGTSTSEFYKDGAKVDNEEIKQAITNKGVTPEQWKQLGSKKQQEVLNELGYESKTSTTAGSVKVYPLSKNMAQWERDDASTTLNLDNPAEALETLKTF